MTIEREEPGIMVAYCDTCGERLVLDTDAEADEPVNDALEELEERGWQIGEPETVKFSADFGVKKLKQTFDNHICEDCQ